MVKPQYTPPASILLISHHLTLWSHPKVKIILHPQEIKQQQQQIPLYSTQILCSPDKIHLHSWMLHTSQAPILDLTGKDIKSMKDIEHTFHALNLSSQENNAEKSNGREETGGTNKPK